MPWREHWQTRWPAYALTVSVSLASFALFRENDLRNDFERDVRTDTHVACLRTNAARGDLRGLVKDLVSLDGAISDRDRAVIQRAAESLPEIDCSPP